MVGIVREWRAVLDGTGDARASYICRREQLPQGCRSPSAAIQPQRKGDSAAVSRRCRRYCSDPANYA